MPQYIYSETFKWKKYNKTGNLFNFNIEIESLLSLPSSTFYILFHFIYSLPKQVVICSWNQGFYFLFHSKAIFANIQTRLSFTPIYEPRCLGTANVAGAESHLPSQHKHLSTTGLVSMDHSLILFLYGLYQLSWEKQQ